MNMTAQGLIGLAPRRRKAKLTQETLAAALGVSRSLLAAWEVGRVWPSSERLPEIAHVLGCEIGELFTEDPEEEEGDYAV